MQRNQYLLLMMVGGYLTYQIHKIKEQQEIQFQATMLVASAVDDVNDTIKAIEDEAVQEIVDERFTDIVETELGDVDGGD